MKTKSPTSSTIDANRLGEEIKLGIDAHKSKYVVALKVDGSLPERPRSFTPEQFLVWVGELLGRCSRLYSCYEAGAFGYCLHRKLEALGATNYVICPINWDERGKGVKTDGRDATAMSLALDGYLRGNGRSFTAVRVPGEQEERLRSVTRLRQSLIKERSRNANRGRSHGLDYGTSIEGAWWRPRAWERLKDCLQEHLLALLEALREIIVAIDEQIAQVQERLNRMESPVLPKGMGTVMFQQSEREVGDWNRFQTRKQVGGYTGLCPSESSSANRRIQGSITKHGNPRLRHMLIECAWLLMRWNPDYRGVLKWRDRLLDAKLTRSSKKKIAVAIARQFAVDWWRVRTGRIQPEEIGLDMKLLEAQDAM